MCVYKRATTRSKLHFAAFVAAAISTIIIGGNASAATTTGGIITEGNARWEYSLKTDGDNQELSIMFYDKDPDATTITVPSLADLTDGSVPGITATLDTYFLKNADTAAQTTAYEATYPRRTATASTTKLDMTNTSKIQILGVKPIIDPNTETELVFGENMVIGDNVDISVEYTVCSSWSYNSRNRTYSCKSSRVSLNRSDIESRFPNFKDMSTEDQLAFAPTASDLGCIISGWSMSTAPVAGTCYIPDSSVYYAPKTTTKRASKAFANYKLKLTNFGDFNYLGWNTFEGSTFNAANTTMTIEHSGYMGGDIFKNTNITKAIIKTEETGPGLFRDCGDLTEVEFADNITKVTNDTFAGTGITSLDFSNTNIKNIGARAFDGVHLTSLNLSGVNTIQYAAFRDHTLTELTLPKSIMKLEAASFKNDTLKKLTIAYDTMQVGTTLPLSTIIGKNEGWSGGSIAVEELNIIAPYGANEEVASTHLNYDQYRWHTNCWTGEYLETDIRETNYQAMKPYAWDGKYQPTMEQCYGAAVGYGWVDRSEYGGKSAYITSGNLGYKFEDDFINVNSYKNIIAPLYFYGFASLKKLSIGEGIEYVGSSAFDLQLGSTISGPILDEVLLPANSLKGIGNLAFAHNRFDTDLPKSLTFIGAGAFQYNNYLDFNFDFPNLVAVGDYAFAETKARDVIFTSSLKYIGNQVFEKFYDYNSKTLHDVTIDLDIFGPEVNVPSLRFNPAKNEWSGQFGFTAMIAGGCYAPEYGTITFTDKVQHEFPSLFVTDALEKKWGGRHYEWFFGIQGCGQGFSAKKIDMSKTGWKVLPKMMTYGSYADEFVLPEHLEVISERAFNTAVIKEPLVIPDSVKIIGDGAFECSYLRYWSSGVPYNPGKELSLIKINSLPSSLEYIGDEAFYGLSTLTADLNAPNLYKVGIRAFQGTNVRDVLIPEGVTVLREGTFADAPSLRNITIDTDFGAAVTNPVDRTINAFQAPQSLINFFSDIPEENRAEKAWRFAVSKYMEDKTEWVNARWENGVQVEEGHYKNSYDLVGKNFETFYTIFNQTMKSAQGTYSGSNGGQELSGEHYGKVIFTDKNVTNVPGNIGVFSWLSYDEFDMSATEWTMLTTAWTPFGGATIGELHLPHGLTTINNCAFQRATVEQPFSVPGSVETISNNSFQFAKLNGISFNSGTKTIASHAFEFAEITEPFALPDTLITVDDYSFLLASGKITNMLPDSVKTIGNAAFFGSDMADDVTIPGSVTKIGGSAFNAGPTDVHYDTVTIEPDLTTENTGWGDSGELVHQMFWNAKMDKMTIKSNRLVGYEKPDSEEVTWGDETRTVYYEEFWHMPFEEIEITNLPTITYAAFRNCEFLKKVDMGKNTNLRTIRDLAFKDDEKLEQVIFAPGIKDETVVINESAFENTGFKTVGKAGSDFNLNAAHFDAAPKVFMNGKKITKVEVPETYSNGTLPEKTFANAPELTEATIDYRVKRIDNAAFSNDNKLKRIFIWGNTIVMDENLPDYHPPVLGGMGEGGSESGSAETFGPTIPEGTDIYAYSTSPTESYAAFNGRESFDGTFYPLDEVLYLTTNKTYVKIDDNKDFDKNGLTVYGLRRDGMVVESDSWAEYDDNSYSRHDAELTFAKMEPTIEENPDFGTVWDTPVPKAELNFANVNFETIDYELVEDPEGPEGVKLINIIYTDKYTEGKPDTDVLPMSDDVDPIPFIPDIIPDTPVTSAINIFAYITSFGTASGVLAVVIRNKLARSRR